jgi:hypothetical protein
MHTGRLTIQETADAHHNASAVFMFEGLKASRFGTGLAGAMRHLLM